MKNETAPTLPSSSAQPTDADRSFISPKHLKIMKWRYFIAQTLLQERARARARQRRARTLSYKLHNFISQDPEGVQS